MTLGAPSATSYHSAAAELSSVIVLPATINAGDTIFLFTAEQTTAPVITWPSGFTDSGITGASRTNLTLNGSTKTAAGTEGGTSVTVTSNSSKARTVIAIVWPGTTGAFVGLGSNGATSASTVCPDTAVAGNHYGVLAVSCQQGAGTPTWTPGAGYTEAKHDASGIAAAAPMVVEYLADTGTITTTGTITNVSSVSNNWATMTLVVVPSGTTATIPLQYDQPRTRGFLPRPRRRAPQPVLPTPQVLPQQFDQPRQPAKFLPRRRPRGAQTEYEGQPLFAGDTTSFEAGTGSWAASSGAPTIATSVTQAFMGAQSLKITATAGGTCAVASANAFGIVPGTYLRITGWVFCETNARNLNFQVNWKTASGSAGFTSGSVATGVLGQWVQVVFNGLVPSTPGITGLSLLVVAASTAISDVFYLDAVDVRRVSYTAPQFTPVGWPATPRPRRKLPPPLRTGRGSQPVPAQVVVVTVQVLPPQGGRPHPRPFRFQARRSTTTVYPLQLAATPVLPQQFDQPRQPGKFLPRRRAKATQVVPTQVAVTAQALPPQSGRPHPRPFRFPTRRSTTTVYQLQVVAVTIPPQQFDQPRQPGKFLPRRRAKATQVIPTVVALVQQFDQPRRFPLPRRARKAAWVPFPATVVVITTRGSIAPTIRLEAVIANAIRTGVGITANPPAEPAVVAAPRTEPTVTPTTRPGTTIRGG